MTTHVERLVQQPEDPTGPWYDARAELQRDGRHLLGPDRTRAHLVEESRT
ncbi:hypothetical protein ACKI1J_05095 [Streptomyces scabiei]